MQEDHNECAGHMFQLKHALNWKPDELQKMFGDETVCRIAQYRFNQQKSVDDKVREAQEIEIKNQFQQFKNQLNQLVDNLEKEVLKNVPKDDQIQKVLNKFNATYNIPKCRQIFINFNKENLGTSVTELKIMLKSFDDQDKRKQVQQVYDENLQVTVMKKFDEEKEKVMGIIEQLLAEKTFNKNIKELPKSHEQDRWKLLFRQTKGKWLNKCQWALWNQYDPEAENYSILSKINETMRTSQQNCQEGTEPKMVYRFKMVWPKMEVDKKEVGNDKNYNEWEQESNPIERSSVTDKVDIKNNYSGNSWEGLRLSKNGSYDYTLLTGAREGSNRQIYYGIGYTQNYPYIRDGNGSETNRVELYVWT